MLEDLTRFVAFKEIVRRKRSKFVQKSNLKEYLRKSTEK